LNERVEITSLRSANNDLKRRLDETEKALATERHVNKTILGIKEGPVHPIVLPPVVHSGGSPGVPMFLWSDWHVGEFVDPEQVYGYNEFNIEIAKRRVERLVNKSIDLATTHVTHPDYEYAVVILGGDFVSGWLHEELVATDCCTPLQAARYAIQMLWGALQRMADAFKRLTVVCVPGNHGRLMKRPPAKLGAYQAFDWLIYGALQDFFLSDTRMSFIVPAEGDVVLNVAGTRYLIMHGHELGVKGGDGLIGSIGPMMRGRLKAGRANASLGRDFDVLVLGHFHQSIWLPGSGLIVNNSLIGYSEYGRQMRFVATPPSQTMWFSHEKYGPIRGDQIFLEDNVDKPLLVA
jgi:predicted phosphodiesterase